MSIFTGVVGYVFLWWLVFLTIVPFGSRSYHEAGEKTETGNAQSAPLKPRIWLKVLISTLAAAVLWGIAYTLISSGVISLRP